MAARATGAPIIQQPVQVGDVFEPTIDNIRLLFTNALQAPDQPAQGWLQRPTDGGNCEIRATEIAKLLKPAGARDQPPRDFKTETAFSSLASKWASFDGVLARQPIPVKGPGAFIGGAGPSSRFNSWKTHHVVVFVARGHDPGPAGAEFYIVFDPDCTATAQTDAAWLAAAPNPATAVSAMVLGTNGAGLGTLFRKYYVRKGELFPEVDKPTGLEKQ